jgi:hypothetical protein
MFSSFYSLFSSPSLAVNAVALHKNQQLILIAILQYAANFNSCPNST